MKKFLMSFVYAARGIRFAFQGQRNIKVQIAVGVLAIGLSVVLKIPPVELAVIIAVSFLVVILEMFNTGFEKLIDVISRSITRNTARSRTSSGCGVDSAIMSVAVGAIILQSTVVEGLLGAGSRGRYEIRSNSVRPRRYVLDTSTFSPIPRTRFSGTGRSRARPRNYKYFVGDGIRNLGRRPSLRFGHRSLAGTRREVCETDGAVFDRRGTRRRSRTRRSRNARRLAVAREAWRPFEQAHDSPRS